MDALRDDRGQAAIFAAALLAVGAMAIAGFRAAEERIVTASVERAAGEAAIEAAAAVVADAYAAEMRARAADPSRQPRDMRAVVSDPLIVQLARLSGTDVGERNGGTSFAEIAVTCGRGAVIVAGSVRDTTFRAGFAGSECSQP